MERAKSVSTIVIVGIVGFILAIGLIVLDQIEQRGGSDTSAVSMDNRVTNQEQLARIAESQAILNHLYDDAVIRANDEVRSKLGSGHHCYNPFPVFEHQIGPMTPSKQLDEIETSLARSAKFPPEPICTVPFKLSFEVDPIEVPALEHTGVRLAE